MVQVKRGNREEIADGNGKSNSVVVVVVVAVFLVEVIVRTALLLLIFIVNNSSCRSGGKINEIFLFLYQFYFEWSSLL